MDADGASGVEFRLLGPVEVWASRTRVDAGKPRQRAVLAALVVDAGRVVPTETLIDRVWGSAVPEHVRATLRAHLSRIRRLLERAGASGSALSRVAGGYVLRVDDDQVDLYRFRRLAAAAHRSADTDNRVELLRAALALWQGKPLTGIEGDWAGRMREIWGRERVDAAVSWARAELAQANPGPVLASLAELADDNPLVESVTEVHMQALHAAGRTSEALDLYTHTRLRLAEELGTDPGPDLQNLHLAMLRGEPGTAPAAGASRLVPRQLPAQPQLFTGRIMELAELDKIHDASIVVITAIDGMAGVGKTALALRAAHRMVHRYPDGQLFIDLHGYTEGVAPVEPGEALDWMLRAVGVGGERIPADLEQRAGLYRSRLAARRMVIVLDNAATEAQIRPLLPGAPGCVVLVTSRRRLAGLDHTYTLSLDTMPEADAVELLRQGAGENRLGNQPPELAAELVELCGRLPLAIRIAAARLRSHPAWDLAHLVRRLRDGQHRLVELEAGPRSVTAALDLSYQDLSVDGQQTYRLLGLHPGADIDLYAAAALLDVTLQEAGGALEQLLDAHLLQEPTPGRYRFHDLTRAHAAHIATRDEPAVDRLLDHYRHTAAMAMEAAYPYDRERRPQVPAAHTPGLTLSDPAAALGWLDTELPNLLAAARCAAELDRPAHLLHLSTILHRHLRTRGPYHDAFKLHHHALTTARAIGDTAAEMDALTSLGHIYRIQNQFGQAIDQFGRALQLAGPGYRSGGLDALIGLGQVYRLQGHYGPALDYLRPALQLARATGHRAAELDALNEFGHIDRLQCRYGPAADHLERALRLARATGHQGAEIDTLVCLGHMQRMHGRTEQAAPFYQQALQLARAKGAHNGELNALNSLGHVHRRQHQYPEATRFFQQALQLANATGHRNGELGALLGLGHIHRAQGGFNQATDHYQRILDQADESGSLNWRFEAWQGFGRLHRAIGDPATALTDHDHALALATELHHPDDQARAHDGLAHAHLALHHPEQAKTHWQRALDILTRLGIDYTEDEETTAAAIRARLETEPRPLRQSKVDL